MAITNSNAAKQAACDAVVDLVDAGAGANGTLEVLDAGSAVLATFDLPNPAFGAANAAGTATANAIDAAAATGTGTAASYRVKDADGDVVWSGTASLAAGDGDMKLDNLSINTGQSVSITSWTHTALSQ